MIKDNQIQIYTKDLGHAKKLLDDLEIFNVPITSGRILTELEFDTPETADAFLELYLDLFND